MSDSLSDPRAYLQKRVALFTAVIGVFFTVQLGLDLLTPAEGEPLLSSTRLASLSVLSSNALVWVFLRKGKRTVAVARGAELFSTTVAMAVFGTLPLIPPVEGAGGVIALFCPILMAVVVLLRAAIVPSPAWLSALVGLVWGVVMTGSAVAGWEGIVIGIPGQNEFPTWAFPLVFHGFAGVSLSVVAGVISHVVHGLQTQVREARELGQYTLESKIGEGGMGAVYRARHRMLRRPTAVKLLPLEKAGEKAIARFEREVQHTSRLTHPNTVAIFDFGRTQDGVFYYAMEYLDGLSLEDLVAMGGPLPPERTVHILIQVAEALSEAHEMGLVHRDIKPDNIILCERGGVADVVKVLDFGLVKDVDAPADTKLSAADTVHGTPLYMAPESVTDPESVDGRTDLYALGATAYFLLSGKPVFEGRVVEVFGHHLHTEPKSLREQGIEIEPDLEAIVLRCLRKDPEERFQSAAELCDALRSTSAMGCWNRSQAQDWWARERDEIKARRSQPQKAGSLTLAPARP